MMIKVLFFGATAEAVGSREIDVELKNDAIVGALLDRLNENFPKLNSLRLIASVNEQYVETDTSLADGDELAIFTAVSGG